jgi:hypothetical protein
MLLLKYSCLVSACDVKIVMAFVSLDSPLCEVPCLILHLVVYRDVTQQAKKLYHLKHVGALKSGLAYLSQCNSGWFCHTDEGKVQVVEDVVEVVVDVVEDVVKRNHRCNEEVGDVVKVAL